MKKASTIQLLALLALLISTGLMEPTHTNRAPAALNGPIYLSETAQARFVVLPRLFDFYAELFKEMNAHNDKISGEDFEKINHFISGQIKLAQASEDFKNYLECNITPYLKDLPSATLRLQNSSQFLGDLSQKFGYLAETLQNQVVIFENQGLISISKNTVNLLTSKTAAESLAFLMHDRGERNASSFVRVNGDLKSYLLKLVVLKTSEPLPQVFGSPDPKRNSQASFNKIISQIEFTASQKLRALTIEVRKNASL